MEWSTHRDGCLVLYAAEREEQEMLQHQLLSQSKTLSHCGTRHTIEFSLLGYVPIYQVDLLARNKDSFIYTDIFIYKGLYI